MKAKLAICGSLGRRCVCYYWVRELAQVSGEARLAHFLNLLGLLGPDIQIAYVAKIWGGRYLTISFALGSINVESILSEADRLKFPHSFFRIFH